MLKNKLNKKKKGFTLIELIVVLAVLAIIALIAIPNFNRIRENSKIKSDQRSADLIEKSVSTLVLEGADIKTDGVYTYNGGKDTGSVVLVDKAGARTTTVLDDSEAILAVLDGAKVQQADDGEGADVDGLFRIEIIGFDSANPIVDVQVGDYSSAGREISNIDLSSGKTPKPPTGGDGNGDDNNGGGQS